MVKVINFKSDIKNVIPRRTTIKWCLVGLASVRDTQITIMYIKPYLAHPLHM